MYPKDVLFFAAAKQGSIIGTYGAHSVDDQVLIEMAQEFANSDALQGKTEHEITHNEYKSLINLILIVWHF